MACFNVELTEYIEARLATIPDYCRDLRVYSMCNEDGPVVIVLVEELVREERMDHRSH